MRLEGKYELEVRRKGKVIVKDSGRNLVTSDGEELAAGRFASTGAPAAINWLALGSGASAPLKSDETLDTEIAGTKVASASGGSVSGNQITFVFEYTHSGAGITVNEAGTFNNVAPSTGVMACRFLTLEFDMADGDVLTLTWTLQFLGVD
jgi:hypothetical protein